MSCEKNKLLSWLGIPIKKTWGQLDASYHMYPHLDIYFGLPLGHYPTFSYSDECRTKTNFQYVKRMLPLFRAVVKFCSTNRLFIKKGAYHSFKDRKRKSLEKRTKHEQLKKKEITAAKR